MAKWVLPMPLQRRRRKEMMRGKMMESETEVAQTVVGWRGSEKEYGGGAELFSGGDRSNDTSYKTFKIVALSLSLSLSLFLSFFFLSFFLFLSFSNIIFIYIHATHAEYCIAQCAAALCRSGLRSKIDAPAPVSDPRSRRQQKRRH